MRQKVVITKLLQSATEVYYIVHQVLQSASGITKCDRLYCKVRQVLQSATVITKWDVTRVIIKYICYKFGIQLIQGFNSFKLLSKIECQVV